MANVDSTREALWELRNNFLNSGSAGEFRPRTVRPGSDNPGGDWEILCVDDSERRIDAVQSVLFRPVCTGTTRIPDWYAPRGNAGET